MRLRGKTAVIAGSGAIAEEAAALFAEEGALVCRLARQPCAYEAEGCIETDLTDGGSVERALARVFAKTGGLHILYFTECAPCPADAGIATLPPAAWEKTLKAGLGSIFHCCKCAVPYLRQSGGGAILLTASSHAVFGVPASGAHAAAVGTAVALTRSMAVEYGQMHIRVNCIVPAGIYESPEGCCLGPGEGFYRKTTVLGRQGTPQEVARVALFLVSDEASYVHGAVVAADGGITVTNHY